MLCVVEWEWIINEILIRWRSKRRLCKSTNLSAYTCRTLKHNCQQYMFIKSVYRLPWIIKEATTLSCNKHFVIQIIKTRRQLWLLTFCLSPPLFDESQHSITRIMGAMKIIIIFRLLFHKRALSENCFFFTLSMWAFLLVGLWG